MVILTATDAICANSCSARIDCICRTIHLNALFSKLKISSKEVLHLASKVNEMNQNSPSCSWNVDLILCSITLINIILLFISTILSCSAVVLPSKSFRENFPLLHSHEGFSPCSSSLYLSINVSIYLSIYIVCIFSSIYQMCFIL